MHLPKMYTYWLTRIIICFLNPPPHVRKRKKGTEGMVWILGCLGEVVLLLTQ